MNPPSTPPATSSLHNGVGINPSEWSVVAQSSAENEAASELSSRLDDRSARVCIIGLGYVGLPTAVAFATAGFRVVGVDLRADRCELLNAGRSPVPDVPDAVVRSLTSAGMLSAVQDLSAVGDCDVFDICVPTPLDKGRDPDVSAIVAAVESLGRIISSGQLIVLTSTTYPGTTVELVKPILESSGLKVGTDIFLAFAPERIDPGNTAFAMRNTPKVVGGVTEACTKVATKAFETIVERVIPVSNPATAEMSKLLENTFRSVNIALANEVAIMCRTLGLDVWEVVDAAASKPYGFMPFYPGPGLGGHCIPIDPGYLSWKLRNLNYIARFIDLAEDINRSMPQYVVNRINDMLNSVGKSIRGSRILLLGLAYKPNVGDLRESPALDIIGLLLRQGGLVGFCDPHVQTAVEIDGQTLNPTPLAANELRQQDLVVVTTPHDAFDFDLVADEAKLVLDTRGWGRRYPRARHRWETL